MSSKSNLDLNKDKNDAQESSTRKKWLKSVKWHKHLIYLFLFLAVIMAVSTVLSKMHQFWDVGANSWFARLAGNGWEYQRGAATVAQDKFDDKFSSVRYLPQGWTPAESMWFYNTTQGSDLLPYDFFLALEKPGTSELFRSNDNLNSYRYLPQKATWSNPDGLRVGFVKDHYKGKDYLGFTCAACHTSQMNYNNIGIRIDGGPAGTDMDTFLKDLTEALCKTRDSAEVRERFVKKVMERGHYDSDDAVVTDLKRYAQRMTVYNVVNHSETRYGYSRLDAFGRIYNRVLEHILTQREINQLLTLTVGEMVKEGKLTQEELNSIQSIESGSVLSGDQRDHIIERLVQALPLKTQLRMSLKIFNRPDAPVSYPFLWDIPQHDYVQWNGLGANAGLGPVGRNTGEVIGVFGTLDWAEEPGTSLSSFIGGQGIKATHISFKSSIDVHNLRLIENQLKELRSPQWPEDILPKIDHERWTRGERLFTTYCESCHTRINRDDPTRRIVAHMSRLADIGTDSKMANNAAKYMGFSGILRNQYVGAGPGQILLDDRAPVAALLTKATTSVVATPGDKNFLVRGYDWAYDLASALFSNEIKASLKHGNYDPDTMAQPYASLYAYKGRSLNGIWATAPYLHNGSVPTLYDLLLPQYPQDASSKDASSTDDPSEGASPKQSSSEDACKTTNPPPKDPPGTEYRPPKFMVGSREFDPVKVGLKKSGYTGFLFNVRRRGNHNCGHEYGARRIIMPNGLPLEPLTTEQRWDLVEYLKSL